MNIFWKDVSHTEAARILRDEPTVLVEYSSTKKYKYIKVGWRPVESSHWPSSNYIYRALVRE